MRYESTVWGIPGFDCEASFHRIYQHIISHDVSWAIFTSWRQALGASENLKIFRELKSIIRNLDYGFIEGVGVGRIEDEDGEVHAVEEPIIFVPKITLKHVKSVCEKYNQWGFIYGERDRMGLFKTDGTRVSKFIEFHPHTVAQFYMKIRGKPLVLEKLMDLPESFFERWGEALLARK